MNQLINKIYFVLDKSGSMYRLEDQVIKVFDNQISYLAQRSKELNQETRITVYQFSDNVECLMYDRDCLRIPNIKDYYKVGGNTKLIDACIQAIKEARLSPELYGDYGHLLFCLSDGLENRSENRPSDLSNLIKNLPDNWTVCALVPDQRAVFEAKAAGFPVGNIQVWSTTEHGIQEVGRVITETTESYMTARAKGVRGTKNLFSLNTQNLNSKTIKTTLQQLNPSSYQILRVSQDIAIKPFVEAWNKTYVPGSAYYQISKPEKIQAYKQILVQDVKNGKVYGGNDARTILGLPNFEVKVTPANHPDYILYAQSTSLNRKLIGGTQLIVLK